MRDLSFVSFHVAYPPLATGDGRKMRCENSKKSRARRVAVRERERVFFPDGIRCSISEVVGAVIVEDRLLSLPLPRAPLALSPDGSLRPTSPVSPKPLPPLLQNAPYANLPAAEGSPCPFSLTFSHPAARPPFSTVSGVIGCPSILSLSPTAQACGTLPRERDRERFSTVHRRSRRVGLRKVARVYVYVCACVSVCRS